MSKHLIYGFFLSNCIKLVRATKDNNADFEAYLKNDYSFFSYVFFDLGYGLRKCIETQTLYPFEKQYADKSDPYYNEDFQLGIMMIITAVLIFIFLVMLIYDIIATPIKLCSKVVKWFKVNMELERQKMNHQRLEEGNRKKENIRSSDKKDKKRKKKKDRDDYECEDDKGSTNDEDENKSHKVSRNHSRENNN
uniref:PIR Superfamily Protein n=1 Tax=Parastrongyloides trichosuri TaxID=131310 RepID=A0A0N4ZGB4_PARTI